MIAESSGWTRSSMRRQIRLVHALGVGRERRRVEPDDDLARRRQRRVVEQRRELGVEDQHAHAGVVDDVRELPCLVTRVHWHGTAPIRIAPKRTASDSIRSVLSRPTRSPCVTPAATRRRAIVRVSAANSAAVGTLVGHDDPAARELGRAVDQRPDREHGRGL